MRNKEVILPGLAAVGGIAGFFLRRWELVSAFEPETGLPIFGTPATWGLIALTVLMVAALALLCRNPNMAPMGSYDQAFAAKGNLVYMTLAVIAGFLMAGSAAVGVLAWYRGERELTHILLAAFSGATALCLILNGKNNYRGEGRGKYGGFLLVPAYTCCLWLIVAYQARSADPVILDYVYQLFSIIATVLGTYFMAGFAFERAKPFRTSYFSLLAVYFLLVALADSYHLSILLLLLALLLHMATSVTVLLYHIAHPNGPRIPRHLRKEAYDKNREETPNEEK